MIKSGKKTKGRSDLNIKNILVFVFDTHPFS